MRIDRHFRCSSNYKRMQTRLYVKKKKIAFAIAQNFTKMVYDRPKVFETILVDSKYYCFNKLSVKFYVKTIEIRKKYYVLSEKMTIYLHEVLPFFCFKMW